MRKFHVDGTLPRSGEVFVFGSNLAGIHGAGAAKVAFRKFGAKYGKGIGLCNQSYAIPTKDKDIKTLPLRLIVPYVEEFVAVANDWVSDTPFFITRIGCGLAGYKDADIAPMFKDIAFDNCSFPIEWKPYL